MVFSIDPNVKGAISESFDKSHLSESFDVPAGCIIKQLTNQSEVSALLARCTLPSQSGLLHLPDLADLLIVKNQNESKFNAKLQRKIVRISTTLKTSVIISAAYFSPFFFYFSMV